jgi:signal transduction histidine kinase
MLVSTVIGGLLLSSSETALRSSLLFLTAYAVGRAAASSKSSTIALQRRAEQLEREQRIAAERAAERERARIARDMHDILSHAVAVMVVQAEAGPVVVRTDPDRAEAAFDAIASAGRDAMSQLRRILDVLTDGDDPLAPQPTLRDLPSLAEKACGPELEVAYAVAGEPRPLLPEAEVAAYRIVQEAVTNVVKHSGASHAKIRLLWREAELEIGIDDDGHGVGRSLPSGGNGSSATRQAAASGGPLHLRGGGTRPPPQFLLPGP